MSDVVVSVVESNTAVTVTEQDVAVDVTENNVVVSVSTAGIQGVPGANNDPTYVTVRNATGATLAKGTIVYISGANGNNVQVSPALATGDSTSARTIGWLAASIPNNGSGLCMVEGYLEGLNTQGFTAGAQLYLSGTVAGAFTATKPQAPIHLVYVGVVTKVSAGDGHVFVKVQNGYEISELHDVLIVSPTNNQVLAYDSATQLWKNATNAPDGVTSITATAPLTGGTITSTGSIGLDQTALSLTRSQISDFASGTVTSAGTAQQAGTAVYSVNSGTAVYATTSGTAVFATNASTAVNLSGSITKSQVSDFTSGTVASASTALQAGTAVYSVNSGTAVYATTSGTAVSISGDITKSQVSDFTSGTVASADVSGTATYAINSGTAVYATTSGTATYSDNSGTAVFATNASTAVTISGSIAQSQVTNLTTDLAGKANLAGGNAFTGAQTVTGTATGSIVQIIRGASGQANDFFSIQNSGGTALARANLNGSFFFGQTTGSYPTFFGASGSLAGMINVVPASAAVVPILVRAAASQSANLLELQSSAAAVLASIASDGQLNLPTAFISAAGQFRLGSSIAGTVFAVNNSGAPGTGSVVGLFRGASGQTADLLKVQNSTPTDLFSISSAGLITAKVVGNAANQSRGLLLSNTSDTWQSGLYLRSDGSGFPRLSLLAPTGALGEAVSIDSAAKVGIGNIAPVAQLDVYSQAAARVGVVIRGAASQTASLTAWQNNAGSLVATMSAAGDLALYGNGITSGDHRVGTATYLSATLNVITRATTEKGLVIRGQASQTANLQEWQNSAGTITARVTSSGEIQSVTNAVRGVQLFTFQYWNQLQERNSGGELTMTKQTAASTNPGAESGRIYFRDGTNAGTLKLCVRAGAAGAETTILDNIPQ
jgi:hypothetical protein